MRCCAQLIVIATLASSAPSFAQGAKAGTKATPSTATPPKAAAAPSKADAGFSSADAGVDVAAEAFDAGLLTGSSEITNVKATVAAPAESASTEDGGTGPAAAAATLSKEQLRDVIKEHRADADACHDEALATDPEVGGKLSVRFTLNAAGEVVDARVTEDTTGSETLGKCLAKSMRSWKFPERKGAGRMSVTYPWLFLKKSK